MRWRGRRQSRNVEDRRRLTPKGAAVGGGIGAIVIAIVVAFLGGDPSAILKGGGGGVLAGQKNQANQPTRNDTPLSAADKELGEFVGTVLADTEDVWDDLFRRYFNQAYSHPKLVLFRDKVQWAGGVASSAMGPFYSPSDKKIFIDLSFYDEMRRRFKAPGDFAQAYVLAHEVGHHIQNLLGISDKVHRLRGKVSKVEQNRASVRLELQADFLAGVWAHHAHKRFDVLEPGDIEEALTAAAAIGDDRLQKQARGHTMPDSFTHGTSAQRVTWFRYGFRTGDPNKGNTFDDAVFRRIDPGG
ncbi:MAG: neutral zinc metallopeptidase [Planctomycetota bacterium]|nr:neutral zinc metallopeptidase [Planctomycetota bacterium]